MSLPSYNFLSKDTNRKVRLLLGSAYLRDGRIEEALEVYQVFLKDFPDDIGALIVLGNLYRLGGGYQAARLLYARVLELSPGLAYAEKQFSLLQVENSAGWDEPAPLSAEAVARLACRLKDGPVRGRAPEIFGAADLAEKSFTGDTAAEDTAHELFPQLPDDFQQLMPALIELQIRQARAAGYSDVAEALQSLQINLTRQAEDDYRWADDLLNFG